MKNRYASLYVLFSILALAFVSVTVFSYNPFGSDPLGFKVIIFDIFPLFVISCVIFGVLFRKQKRQFLVDQLFFALSSLYILIFLIGVCRVITAL